jgi:hypothetical protein
VRLSDQDKMDSKNSERNSVGHGGNRHAAMKNHLCAFRRKMGASPKYPFCANFFGEKRASEKD